MSYTPGPFIIRSRGEMPEGDPGGDYALICGGIIGWAFHRIDDNHYADAKANATLWAAAPDLLRACKRMVAADDMMPNGKPPYDRKQVAAGIGEQIVALEMARAAIARAEVAE